MHGCALIYIYMPCKAGSCLVRFLKVCPISCKVGFTLLSLALGGLPTTSNSVQPLNSLARHALFSRQGWFWDVNKVDFPPCSPRLKEGKETSVFQERKLILFPLLERQQHTYILVL